MPATMNDRPDLDAALREDVRMLGRLLGRVLQERTGEAGFALIENIRQTAVRFRRASPGEAGGARTELTALLGAGLPLDRSLFTTKFR